MKDKKLKIITIALPIIAVGLILILKFNIVFFLSLLPQRCLVNAIWGIQCPGCGNTRSVLALLNLDFISSLKYNISPICASIAILLAYIELVFKAFFHKKITLLPRKVGFWIGVSIVFVLYFILRNLI